MDNEALNIDYEKLAAFLSGETTPEENAAIALWIKSSDVNQKTFDQCKKLFQADFHEIPSEEVLVERVDNINLDKAWMNVAQKLNLPEAPSNVRSLTDIKREDNKSSDRMRWIGIAASFILSAIVVFSYIYLQGPQQTIVNNSTGTQEIYLPDNSKIVLQGSTQISYDNDFNKDHRSLSLKGKAFFDVKSNDALPFIISTQAGKITVVGTAFLVEENATEVIVEVDRGKVTLAPLTGENNDFILLEKNEKGILTVVNKRLEKENVDNMNHLFWANKKLTYRQATLKEVLDELSVIFEKEIVYDENIISNCRISAVYMDQPFEAIINNISLSLQFDYEINGNRVEINSNGCSAN